MSETKFTPGKWTIHEDQPSDHDKGGYQINAQDTEQLAYVWNEARRYGSDNAFGAKEARANAYLIAAAPDLLAALEKIITGQDVAMPVELDEEIHSLIARAKGEK